jgi:hypothetical protein
MPTWTIETLHESGKRYRKKYYATEQRLVETKFILACIKPTVRSVTLYETDLWLFSVPFEYRTYVKYVHVNNTLWRLGAKAVAAIPEKIPPNGGIASLEGYLLEDNPFKRNSISRQLWEKEYREMSDITTIVTPYFDVTGDVNLIPFEALAQWKYPFIQGFQYDDITDSLIDQALFSTIVDKVNIDIEHEDDKFLLKANYPEEYKHALRIAAIVKHLHRGGKLNKPIEIDTFWINTCCSCIGDGHHRLRALQYVKADCFVASLSGEIQELDKLIELSKR